MAKKDKHKRPSLIPKSVSKINNNQNKFLDTDITQLRGNQDSNNTENSNVLVSIRFLQYDYQCFSEWTKSQMKSYWKFQDKVFKCTWNLLKSHDGLKMKEISRKNYPGSTFLNRLSPEISIVELRVSKRMRVHGFRKDSVLYVCWLDKDHQICPE